jgi:SAM-dependent methyltransferase
MAGINEKVLGGIRAAFPSFSEEECGAALLLLQARADALGTTLERYMAHYHPHGLAERDDKLSGNYRGYVRFLGDDAKAIIKTGKHADFSTFVHESAHIFRRQLKEKLLRRAEQAFGVQDRRWTGEQEEAFARGFEEFIRTRTAETQDLRSVYKRAPEFVQKVYRGLDRLIDLTPEMKSVYEEIFQTNSFKINGKDIRFDQKRYEEHIEHIAAGDKKGAYVLLGMTPTLYEELGFERLPLFITRKHLSDIMHPEDMYSREHFHGVDESLLKQVPEQLKKPLLVIQSREVPEDIISIVELRDKNNQPLLAPVAQKRSLGLGGERVTVNFVKSIYAKDNLTYLAEAVRENRLLYADRRRSRTLLRSVLSSIRLSETSILGTASSPSVRDIFGFYKENIAHYKDYVKSISLKNAEILYQTNVGQMRLDFGSDVLHEAMRRRVEAKRPSARKGGKPAAAVQQDLDFDDKPTEAKSPDEPIVIGSFDYTRCLAKDVLLVAERDILTAARPEYIPPLDEDALRKIGFMPPVMREGENFRIFGWADRGGEKSEFLVTPEIFAATVDYYLKRQRARARQYAAEYNEKRRVQAAEALARPEKYSAAQLAAARSVIAGESAYLRKAERVVLTGENRMAHEQLRLYRDAGLDRAAAFAAHRSLHRELRQKMADMQSQMVDLEKAYAKGAETAYGEGGTSGALLAGYGVKVKRQNGTVINAAETAEIRAALAGVSSVFGDLSALSRGQGLKISYAGALDRQTRKNPGLYQHGRHTIGLSFGKQEDAALILAHESAHFLDAAAGADMGHFFASDKAGTPEAELASAFRRNIPYTVEKSNYWNRTCECFARAMEQYAGRKLSPGRYAELCKMPGYCTDEAFTQDIAPLVEAVFAARAGLWHGQAAEQAPVQKPEPAPAFSPYGAWTDFDRRLTVAERERLNAAGAALLENPADSLTAADLDILRRYSGFGGTKTADERGVLYDYYTSPPIADMTWKLLEKASGGLAGSVLEPSCGTGVFFETAPENLRLTGVEIDPRTAKAAALLHPETVIVNRSFEQFNLSESAGAFHHVIGNAPFGSRSTETAFMDEPAEKSLDRYFVSRGIDNLREGGTMALIVAPGVLENKTNAEWRLALGKKAQFLGAIKLSRESFSHTHTAVQPDILFFRKYPADITARFAGMSAEAFQETPFFDKDFVDGTYFSRHPNHVMGEISEGAGQWGQDEVTGKVTPEAVQKTLSDFTPTEAPPDSAFAEIRGKFQPQYTQYGKTLLSLTAEEADALETKRLSEGQVKIYQKNVYILNAINRFELVSTDEKLAEKLADVLHISEKIGEIREKHRGNVTAAAEQAETKRRIDEFSAKYGAFPAEDKAVSGFLQKNPAVKGVYAALVPPDAEILTVENIFRQEVDIVDGHNPAVAALVRLQEDMLDGSEENIRRCFPANADALLAECRRNPDIFLTPDNKWELREDFIAGGVWEKIDALKAALEEETDEAKKAKWTYGAAELERAVGWTPIEEADFAPYSSWVPEDIVNAWVRSPDGLHRDFLGNDSRLARGRNDKWGVIYNRNTGEIENGRYKSFKAGEWYEKADQIVYYLNMQKQRSQYLDTEVYNRECNENFKNFIANHPQFRDELEQKYNRIFNGDLTAPVKTYPVKIAGWNEDDRPLNEGGTGGKKMRAHQWQSLHHVYRQGKGISALGTGFGKTLTGVALLSVLRQEGKVHRAWLQVPNNKVKDWIDEIKAVMPSLKIAAIDLEEKNASERYKYSDRTKRYRRYQEMANSKADIIIMPESAADEIQLSPENDRAISADIARAYQIEGEKAGASLRRLALARERGLLNAQIGRTNRTVSFEDFGCDAIVVDEGHRYKNLFTSSLSRETGMNDGRKSDRAMSLFKKTEYIRGRNDGKNVFMLTATPLTNSPLEYFNMISFVAPEELKRFNIHTIDGFIKNFADIQMQSAYDWKSDSLATKRTLVGFKNLQSLQSLFFKYTDYQNDPSKVDIKKPRSVNHPNVIPQNKEQSGILKEISAELERYQKCNAEERRDQFPGQNYLTFYSQMRTASLDLELFDPQAHKDWGNPKMRQMAENAFASYRNTKGGQVVFCDRVFDSSNSFNIHDKIKAYLVKAGFKDNEIVIINGFTKGRGAKSEALAEQETAEAVKLFNSGKYKVIIGTTPCIGEGLNLQKNSAALHHLDIPYRPSDFIQRNGRIDRQGNAQKEVTLHTYMSAGTIDNYSVNLVQKKANWIDTLLKTKSNVFTNPEDDRFVDADEILLALTEEWGDKGQAAERRAELERRRAETERDARREKCSANLAQLAVLRGAMAAFTGDKGAKSFQSRLSKAAALEKIILDNPEFTDEKKRKIVQSGEPFLYAKAGDILICKGDMYANRYTACTVTSLDFKRRQFIAAPVDGQMPRAVPVQETGNGSGEYFSKPSAVEKRAFAALQERLYRLHLATAEAAENPMPAFTKEFDNDKLCITEFNPYYQMKNYLNPFNAEDKRKIADALEKGVEFPSTDAVEQRRRLADILPELSAMIARREGQGNTAIMPLLYENTPANLKENVLDLCRHFDEDAASAFRHLLSLEHETIKKHALADAVVACGAEDPAGAKKVFAEWSAEAANREQSGRIADADIVSEARLFDLSHVRSAVPPYPVAVKSPEYSYGR